MTAPPLRRPWHRRKRLWAAVALWLPFAYLSGEGPAWYAVARGRVPKEVMRLWSPADGVEGVLPDSVAAWYRRVTASDWYQWGFEHRQASPD